MKKEKNPTGVLLLQSFYRGWKVGVKEYEAILEKDKNQKVAEYKEFKREAFETRVILCLKDGYKISEIAHKLDLKGTAFVYEILDRRWPEWKTEMRKNA